MSQTILIIEDEPSIADNIIYALNSEGFECEWKNLAIDGLQRVQEGGIDLLILDVGLPDQNGFETCKQIRTFSDLPIIFLTARSEEIDRVVGLEIGGDDYVTKPFSPRELAARVRLRLNKHQPAQKEIENRSQFFFVDNNKKCILYKSQELNLTGFEYKILNKFISKPEYVFSREQLMSVVRDLPDVALDRSIDTHIKSLRAKLKEIDEHANPIKTHRGLGYSLSLEEI